MSRSISTKVLGLVLCASGVLPLAACGGEPSSGTRSSSSSDVVIEAFTYQPPKVRIETGESVVWTNDDDIAHTVMSGSPRKQGVPGVSDEKPAEPDGVFDEELSGRNSEISVTFDEPGTYTYYCDIHAGMTGTVLVSE